jgi:hypothetical protein
MGVPGLNGIHTWNDGVALNDLSVWPRYRLLRIPGLHTRPEMEDTRDQPAGRLGEIARRAILRGKNLVYEGVLEARNQDELEQARDALLAAFTTTTEGRMSITRADGSDPFFYTARCTALDPPEELPDAAALHRSTYGYERAFTLGLRLSDPRFYSDPAKGPLQTGAVVPQAGTPLPWRLPVALIAPGAASGVVVVTNAGTAPADPVVEMHGPALTPAIVNDRLGLQVRLALSLAAGQFVRVDFRDRSLLLGGSEDVGALLDRDATTWWDDADLSQMGLQPGDNPLRYSADGLQDPAFATVTFNDAWWS